MATTILNKGQVPLSTVFTDGGVSAQPAIFTVHPQVPVTPTIDAQAASKKYVDDQLAGAVTASATGLDVKQSVRAATLAATGTYTATTGAKTRGQITAAPNILDGITLVAGNRVLVKNHGGTTSNAANGIYVVTTLGTGANGVWDRATDFDDDNEVTANAFTFVEEGTLADTAWVVTSNNSIIIGGASGTAIEWAQFAGNGTITLANIAGTLQPNKGGTGSQSITGIVRGNGGTNPMTAATEAEMVSAIGNTAVANATNASNSSISADNGLVTPVFLTWVTAQTGNLPEKVSTNLTYIPSTGILSSTGFAGSGTGLTNLTAANLAANGTIPASVLANSNISIGTTTIALNRAAGNLALAGILSVGYVNGANTATLSPGVMAGNIALTLPLLAGSLVGTGDSGTVTNTMLAGSIADTKLSTIVTAGKVNASALTGNLFILGTTNIAALATVTTIAGMSSITSTTFIGNLTGNVTGNTSGTAGSVSQSATFNNSGTGAASGITYNGSAAQIISWNTIGAQAAVTGTGGARNYFAGIVLPYTTATTDYTIANTPLVGTLMVFVNGILQTEGAGSDYTVVTGNIVRFTFTPTAADIVSVTYFK